MDQQPRLLKNRYVLGDVIGQGGMAAVHRARDTALDRDVAIKLFPSTTDEASLKRSEDEVSVLASMSHHGLVTLFDAGIDRSVRGENRVFLVMELINGTDLQRKIATEQLVARQIAMIGYDLAEALQYVHSRGVVHRDVKPSNVMFVEYSDDSTRARVKLTDFGIAHRGIEKASADSVTTGTAAYLSPEQVRREEVGPPTDIYALGLVLLECFTGVLAFPGDPTESALARLERDPFIPRGLSDGWRSLLHAMTSRNPADRPPAPELVLALRALAVAEMGRHADEPMDAAASEHTETAFDRITALAAQVLRAPVAVITVSPSGYEWLLSTHSIDLAEIERAKGRQGSAVLYKSRWDPTVTGPDPSVLADPAVAAQLGMGFHLSVPVMTPDGVPLGTLSVMDTELREPVESDIEVLSHLAAVAVRELYRQLDSFLIARDADLLSQA